MSPWNCGVPQLAGRGILSRVDDPSLPMLVVSLAQEIQLYQEGAVAVDDPALPMLVVFPAQVIQLDR